jgi:hypothetical protein
MTTTTPGVTLGLTNPESVASIRIAESLAGLASAPPQPYANPTPFTLAPGLDGTRTVYVQWEDNAGNFSAPAGDSITLDLRNPVGNVAINGGAPGVRSLAVTLSFPASDTDIDTIQVSNSPTMAPMTTFGTFGTAFSGTVPWTLAGPLTNGLTKVVYVTFHDLANRVSDPLPGLAYSAGDSTRVDLTRPVMHGKIATRLYSGSGFTGNLAPLRVAWLAASDTISGVASYTVWVSKDRHAYTLISTQAARAINTLVAPGHTYRYRVLATDGAGNRSAVLYSSVIKAAAYQDVSRAVIYRGRWHVSRSPLYSGGTVHYSTARLASASLRFVGRSVAWVAPTGLTRGSARVYVDGRLRATISLNTTLTAYRRVVFARTWSSSATHTIRIIVLGTAGHPRVDLDSFVILR